MTEATYIFCCASWPEWERVETIRMLRDFHFARDFHLRVEQVLDDWKQPVPILVMDAGAARYTTTIREMKSTLSDFRRGIAAAMHNPEYVRLQNEEQIRSEKKAEQKRKRELKKHQRTCENSYCWRCSQS